MYETFLNIIGDKIELIEVNDNDLKNRKKIFIEEALKYFSGIIFAPYDLEEIILK